VTSRGDRGAFEEVLSGSLVLFKSPAVSIRTASFNIQQFYFLPTQCIYVFCVDLRTAVICLYSIN
jgi:hypothetical protein